LQRSSSSSFPAVRSFLAMSWEDEDWVTDDDDSIEACSRDLESMRPCEYTVVDSHEDGCDCEPSSAITAAAAELESWEDQWSDESADNGALPQHISSSGTQSRPLSTIAIVSGLKPGPVRRYKGGVVEEDNLGYFFHDRGCCIANVHLSLSRRTGESEGVGIIQFEDADSFARALSLAAEAASILPTGKDGVNVRAVDLSVSSEVHCWEDCVESILSSLSLPREEELEAPGSDMLADVLPQISSADLVQSNEPEWRRQQDQMVSNAALEETSVPERRCRDDHRNLRCAELDDCNVPEWRRRDDHLLHRRRVRLPEFLDARDEVENERDNAAWRPEALRCEIGRSNAEPEWRRRPRLHGQALGDLRWLLRQEAVARGVAPLHPATRSSASAAEPRWHSVQDGVCQTEKVQDPCSICMAAPRTHACAPCGHCCMCSTCAKRTGKRCPICRMMSDFGVFRIIFDVEKQLASKRDADDAVPEWRRRHTAQQHPRKLQRQLDEGALEKLQQVLLANTAKRIAARPCTTRDQGSQTDESSSGLCMVCKSAPSTHAAWPCGHHCVCRNCAEHEWCPVCSKECMMFRIYR